MAGIYRPLYEFHEVSDDDAMGRRISHAAHSVCAGLIQAFEIEIYDIS